AQFFGISLGSRELERLIDELRGATLPLKDAEFQRRLETASTAVRVLRAEAPRSEGRHELSSVMESMRNPLTTLSAALKELLDGVSGLRDSSADIDKLYEQLFSAIERLSHLASDETWDGLRWLDVNPRSIRLNLTPLDVADTLSGLINNRGQAWIFTSATLAVGEDFGHFTERMGINGAAGLTFPSPYSLEENGLVWLPPGLPQPSDRTHTGEMLENVMPLLDMTGGGMFCLFTSHRALNAARKWFKTRKKRLNGRPLLIQGDAPRDDLLRRFRDYGNAVLLGTGSFWEGVDVRGNALTIVAIDKLPFASPADPLMMARLEYIRRQGGNGFTGHQLPLAVLSLKQGAGRLLRDETDYGIVVLCDPRISSKSYGSVFLDSLAPMRTTESMDDVRTFLAAHESSNTGGRRAG
ncbi:MAG: ATP-dependent DNA helicase, partial [Woeseiaceae bacterium]